MATNTEHRCLYLTLSKAQLGITKHLKSLGGFYNGLGWFIPIQQEDSLQELCNTAGVKYAERSIESSFEEEKKSNSTFFKKENLLKVEAAIVIKKHELNIDHLSIEELLAEENLEKNPTGKELMRLIDEKKRIESFLEYERLSNISLPTRDYATLLDPVTEAEIIEELKNISPGVDTGYMIGEVPLIIPGGAITILAAPTSHGKTSVGINFCLGALEKHQDISVHFFSYEESRAAIMTLFLNTNMDTAICKKNNRNAVRKAMCGKWIFEEIDLKNKFTDYKNAFFEKYVSNKRLHVHYSDYTVPELAEAIKHIKKNSNVGLICIDYMQLLTMGIGQYSSRQEELKHICLLLKDCAVETGLPILLGAQFNRTVVCEGNLSPTAIGEAGDIERIANMIIGFWNRNFEGFSIEGNKNKAGQKVTKESTLYMEILKGRSCGAGASAVLQFDGNLGRLTPIQQREIISNTIKDKKTKS